MHTLRVADARDSGMEILRTNLVKDEVLFQEGETGECAYVIESGKILIVHDVDGSQETLGVLGPGEYFGEMALVSQQPRMASAIAGEDCILTVVTRKHLEERLAKSDPLVRHMLHLTLRRYREALNQGFIEQPSGTTASADEQLAINRMRTEQALLQALENDEFLLYFQPIVRLADRVTMGFEALLRWNKPGTGLIAPNLFIPIAEDSHIIEKLGHWIIDEGCRCRAQLARQYEQPLHQDFTVSINLAARQFQDPELVSSIGQSLSRHGLDPKTIRMEVTESQIMEDLAHTLTVLQGIRSTGCKIAIDDFGTGHSSLAYLSRLPVDTLKIDKAFLLDAMSDESSQKIIAGVAALARSLGMGFIAEGGETEEQICLLQDLGVEQVQGYYFSKPFPLAS